MEAAKKSSWKEKSHLYFEGFMKNGSRVTVKNRCDRKPQLSLFVASQQKCQIVMEDGITLELASKILSNLAQKVVDGSVALQKLFEERDKLLALEGFFPKKRGMQEQTEVIKVKSMKRPGHCAVGPILKKRVRIRSKAADRNLDDRSSKHGESSLGTQGKESKATENNVQDVGTKFDDNNIGKDDADDTDKEHEKHYTDDEGEAMNEELLPAPPIGFFEWYHAGWTTPGTC